MNRRATTSHADGAEETAAVAGVDFSTACRILVVGRYPWRRDETLREDARAFDLQPTCVALATTRHLVRPHAAAGGPCRVRCLHALARWSLACSPVQSLESPRQRQAQIPRSAWPDGESEADLSVPTTGVLRLSGCWKYSRHRRKSGPDPTHVVPRCNGYPDTDQPSDNSIGSAEAERRPLRRYRAAGCHNPLRSGPSQIIECRSIATRPVCTARRCRRRPG